jgi:hypothetical protein
VPLWPGRIVGRGLADGNPYDGWPGEGNADDFNPDDATEDGTVGEEPAEDGAAE